MRWFRQGAQKKDVYFLCHGNIIYLPRQGGGWLYLAVWLDHCSRKIVGWDVRDIMPEDLVSEVLRRVLVVRCPAAGLVVQRTTRAVSTRPRDSKRWLPNRAGYKA